MTEEKFLEDMVDLMDTEAELSMETVLKEIEEWDSLSTVSFIAFAARKGAGSVTVQDVKAAHTVKDLYQMIAGGK